MTESIKYFQQMSNFFKQSVMYAGRMERMLCTHLRQSSFLYNQLTNLLTKYIHKYISTEQVTYKHTHTQTNKQTNKQTVLCCQCIFTSIPSLPISSGGILQHQRFFPLSLHSSWRAHLVCNCRPVWSSPKLCLGLSFSKLHFVS